MHYDTFLFAVVVIAFAIYRAFGKNTLPATSDDWFVILELNGDKGFFNIWFYPIICFYRKDGETVPITSVPDFTKKQIAYRLAEQKKRQGPTVENYGKQIYLWTLWVRGGAVFKASGMPLDSHLEFFEDFSRVIEELLIQGHKIACQTSVPIFYQELIKQAADRKKKWDEENEGLE